MEFVEVRQTMAKRLQEPGIRQAYKANIAMCIYDNRRSDGRLNLDECNTLADKLLTLIFDS